MSEPCDLERRFNADVCTFRQWMGTKAFWQHPTKPDAAKRAIATQYLTFEFANPDRVTVTFQAVMSEYMRRALWVGYAL